MSLLPGNDPRRLPRSPSNTSFISTLLPPTQGGGAGTSGSDIDSGGGGGVLSCRVVDGIKVFSFPPGVFEIGEQLLVPDRTTIIGASR